MSRVLVVDDSLTVRMDLAAALEEAGLEVEAVSSLAAARASLARGDVSLAVLDVHLPDGDGIELLREIKKAPETAALPVLLLSSEAEVRDRIRGLKTGADDYVGKPYDALYVVGRVRALVGSAPAGPRSATILLIDDSVTFRDIMTRALEAAGYGVATAVSGEEGLRRAAETRPDAIVVDLLLPGIDGPTVIQRIRSDQTLRRTPCVLLTASSSDERQDELKALEAGADAFVSKGVDTRVILSRIAALLRSPGDPALRFEAPSLFGPKKLLAVDDSPTYLDELATALRSEGYDLALARSGEEALELLTVQPVDAILLDLVMPGLSGQETCRRIKQSPAWRDTPVLILTARDEREALIEAIDVGADDYITKSGDFEILRARLRAQLRRRRFETETRTFRTELFRREREALEAKAARELAEVRLEKSEQIREKQEVVDSFFMLSGALLCIVGFDGFFKRVNPAWTEILGWSEAELLARPFLDFVHPEDRARTVAEFESNRGGRMTLSFDNLYLHKDGSSRRLHWAAVTSSKFNVVCAVARDVTERHELIERLQAQADKLQLQTEELQAQGEELLAQQRELETKNVELERASRLKSEFLANMSHELRTPLNAVIGFSELLIEEGQGKLAPNHLTYSSDILSSGRHLLALINDILDLAKIESGRATLSIEPVEVSSCVSNVCSLVGALAHKKGLSLTTVVATERRIRADPAKIRQILINLLSNAVKFSPKGSAVELVVGDAGDSVRFSVRDHGPGIPSSLLPRLFQPFVQGEMPLVKRHEGTGLGLAISKRLVEQHDGTIGVKTAEGEGSTFFFTIPVWTGPLPAPAPVEAPRAIAAAEQAREAPRARPLVILVEDRVELAKRLCTWLQEAGYEVALATKGEDALALAGALRPRAFVLDVTLEREDGLALLERLKGDARTQGLPVVITSSLDETPHGLALGAADCFVKPIDRAALVQRLGSIVVPAPSSNGPLVALIDDDPAVGALLRPALETAGYRLATAATAAEGLELARRESAAVFIVDIMLPDASGFDVVEALAASERTREVPVVVLTAADLTGDERERLRKHVRALAEKGDVTRDALVAALRRAIGDGPARRTTGPLVLIVDDHDLNRELARTLLERKGYGVITAVDGEAAVETARRERPALILMDLAMPKKDGFTAARELKADPATRAIPILALTALAMRSDEERVRQAGFDGYITKPIDRPTLERALDSFLS